MNQLNIPVIFATIGSDISDELSINAYSTVSIDDVQESRKMVEYLISLGHRKIAILTEGNNESSIVKLRFDGYCDALRRNNIEIDDRLIKYVDKRIYTMKNGYETTKTLIESGVKFTALFCISDVLAMGALRAFADAGIRVPEDVSVAGFDGQEMSQFTVPRLTTIRQPLSDISEETMRLIFDLIEEKRGHKHLTFPGELIKAESTKEI